MGSAKRGVCAARTVLFVFCSVFVGLAPLWHSSSTQAAQQATAAPGSIVRKTGTVKAVSGNQITLTPDAGPDVQIMIQDTTRIGRIAPGQTDLKSATPLQLTDIRPGDRLLVGGKLADDGQSVVATTVIVMKLADVQAVKRQQEEDWQKRGIGGLVNAVDPAAGTVTISTTIAGVKKSVAVQVAAKTIVRRYDPNSVKFEDAKVSTVDQIHPGDQLRARGTISADGASFAAEEIVSGTFHNLSGTISSIDAEKGSLSVKDLATKKTFLVSVTADSQVRRLQPFIAQRLAARLKGESGGSGGGGSATGANGGSQSGGGSPGGFRGGGGGGGMDFQQILSRLPVSSLSDFQKGDAVMIVSTEGMADSVTAITLLGGVEPILEASPSAGGLMLSPWSIGAPSGGDAGGQ